MWLLCGGTGLLGGRVAERLARQGVPLRLLVRPDGQAPDGGLGAETVPGDLRDPASLERAVAGASTVVTTVTAVARALAGAPLGIREVDGLGTLALIDAAERAGVERFVFVSYAGLSDAAARAHPIAAAKRAVERRLAASPMRAVVVRPDCFQELWLGPLTGFDWERRRVVVLGQGRARQRYVALDDVAEAVARLAAAGDAPALVEFGGPEPVSRREAVDIFARATGRPIRRIHVPRAALRAGMRVLRRPRPAVASVMGLGLYGDLQDAGWSDAPLRALGIEPRSVTEYARECAAAAR
jgi:NADH dehydrogenase